MIKLSWLLLLIIPLPFAGLAQNTITGKVLSLADKKPVANASVFLSNATVGTSTAADGSFTLSGIREGQYDLVVSIVGFEVNHQNVLVNKAVMVLPAIELMPKITALKEVNITPDPNRDQYYQSFKREFLGTSAYAEECTIVNPEILNISFDKEKSVLTASSDDFLIIVNKALGYRIKYLLTDFSRDDRSRILRFQGSVLFEELKGSEQQQKRWQKRRLDAYLGSSMHFLRSAIISQVTEQNFKVLRLIRKPNPAYKDGADSQYINTLVNAPVDINDVLKRTDLKGIYAFGYPDCLYVMYTKKHDYNNTAMHHDYKMPDYLTTIVSFDEPYVLVDHNGIILDTGVVLFEGSWGKDRIAELLPVDYEPPVIK